MSLRKLSGAEHIHSLRRDLKGIALFLGLIWLVFVVDRFLPLENFGLIPRSLKGLVGIITLPFLHADWSHLTGNSVPLAVLLLLLAGSRANSIDIVVLISLLAGVALWLMGRTAIHIGASVLVFGLVGFLVCAGFFEKRMLSAVIAIGVAITYGSTLLAGILPTGGGVSWEGHLFGAAAGALVAYYISGDLRRGTGDGPRV
ncbi:rhomboid family intramembrane serine protease [Chromatiales bacterium (ex Bugula neritina AB1)]|nr:rhomboid family intramembrane serine protease [Chromatiales bacterium (ex Bugula neritina AB1)]